MRYLLLFLAVLLASSCTGQLPKVNLGKCPNICVAEKSSISAECSGLMGCKVKGCKGPAPKQFSCSASGEKGIKLRIQPGQELVLESLKVGTPYPISIDLFAQPLPVDFYLLADATGSMSGAIDTVRKEFGKVIDAFKANPLIENPRFGVGFYRDERSKSTDNGFKNLQSITADAKLAQKAVSTLRANAGGDRDEANLVALFRVATQKDINWRKDSRKILVYFGDVPGHEPTCAGPDGRLDRARVIDALVKKGITVVGISLDRSFTSAPQSQLKCGEPPAKGSQAKAIVEATGGVVKTGSAKTLIDDITETIEFLPTSVSVDATKCAGKVESEYDPSLPAKIRSGEVLSVKQTLTVPPEFCPSKGKPSAITCKLQYSESGAALPDTVIRVKEVTGC